MTVDVKALEEARAEVEALRREQGVALLDGRAFDHATLAAAEQRIAAIKAALAEIALRDERDAEAKRARRRRRAAQRLVDLEERRLTAIGAAETGLRGFVQGVNDALETSAGMRDALASIGQPVPLPLAESALADRLAQRAAAVLAGIVGHPARLSRLTWAPSWRSGDEDWERAERAELDDDLSAFRQQGSKVRDGDR